MIKESGLLLEEMNTRLAAINGLAEDDLQSIHEAIQIVSDAIAQLKKMIVADSFHSTAEEIHFFKQIKPQFDGRLIFYLLLLRLHTCQASTDPADRQEIYSKELERLQPFYQQHYSFWQYYIIGQTYLDEHYFLRHAQTVTPLLEEDHIHYDWQTNTLKSVAASRIHAYELLREHAATLTTRISISPQKNKKANNFSLHWTSAKAGLIELIYALQEYGVFNNSQVEIKKISDYLSAAFSVHLANIYKTYEDIRLRKKSRTPFLDALKAALEKRIDRDNENAM